MNIFIAFVITVFLIGAVTAIVGMFTDNEKTVYVGGSIIGVLVAVYTVAMLYALWAWALA